MSLVTLAEIKALMSPGVADGDLQAMIDREEDWLANDPQLGIGQLSGSRIETLWIGRSGHRGDLLLQRPTTSLASVTDNGADVAADTVLTGPARIERKGGAWTGPAVVATYTPSDQNAVKRVVVELVRLAVSMSPFQQEAAEGQSRAYDAGGAEKARRQMARTLHPHAGPMTSRLQAGALPMSGRV